MGCNQMTDEYERFRKIPVELDGVCHKNTFRVAGHSVIVYYESEIKFVDFGLNRPETVAR